MSDENEGSLDIYASLMCKAMDLLVQKNKRIAELEKENLKVKTKLSDYASELWVLQELRDRASNMDVDDYGSTHDVKWYASRILSKGGDCQV